MNNLAAQFNVLFPNLRWSRVMVFAAMALFLTVLAPFGTHYMQPIWVRGGYWVAMIFGGAGIATLNSGLWARFSDLEQSRPFSWAVLGLILTTSIPITLMVSVVGSFFSFEIGGQDYAFGTGGADFLTLFLYVVTITAAITIGSYFVEQTYELRHALVLAEERANELHRANPESDESLSRTDFAMRLSLHLRQSELVSVSSDDHYLEVVASNGREQIRCTMAEAVEELAAVNGRLIHRSHWVARNAIHQVIRNGGKAFVQLNDERQLPISRQRLKDLTQEGWLSTSSHTSMI